MMVQKIFWKKGINLDELNNKWSEMLILFSNQHNRGLRGDEIFKGVNLLRRIVPKNLISLVDGGIGVRNYIGDYETNHFDFEKKSLEVCGTGFLEFNGLKVKEVGDKWGILNEK